MGEFSFILILNRISLLMILGLVARVESHTGTRGDGSAAETYGIYGGKRLGSDSNAGILPSGNVDSTTSSGEGEDAGEVLGRFSQCRSKNLNLEQCKKSHHKKMSPSFESELEALYENDSKTSSNPQQAGNCTQERLSKLQKSCEADHSGAMKSCDADASESLNELWQYGKMLTGVGAGMTGGSIEKACGGIAKLALSGQTAFTAFEGKCALSRDGCMSSCRRLKVFVNNCYQVMGIKGSDGVDEYHVCENQLSAKVREAQQSLNNTIALGKRYRECEKMAKGGSFCDQNPHHPGCSAQLAQDCSNPKFAAANQACICVDSPNSTECRMAQKADAAKPGESLSAKVTQRPSSNLPPDTTEEESGSIFGDKEKPGALGQDPGGNKGGGGPRMAQGGPLNSMDTNQKAEGPTPSGSASLEGGGYMNPTGGTGLGGVGNGGSGGGEAPNRFRGYVAAPSEKTSGPDLRRFLPGGQLDPKFRTLASQGGQDGITGPHTNIWLKIKNRYIAESYSLILSP